MGIPKKQNLLEIFKCHYQKVLKSQDNSVALTVCLTVTICMHKHAKSFSFMLYLLRGAPLQSSSILPSESLSEIRNIQSISNQNHCLNLEILSNQNHVFI